MTFVRVCKYIYNTSQSSTLSNTTQQVCQNLFFYNHLLVKYTKLLNHSNLCASSPTLNFKSAFCAYGFHMILSINMDNFLKQQ